MSTSGFESVGRDLDHELRMSRDERTEAAIAAQVRGERPGSAEHERRVLPAARRRSAGRRSTGPARHVGAEERPDDVGADERLVAEEDDARRRRRRRRVPRARSGPSSTRPSSVAGCARRGPDRRSADASADGPGPSTTTTSPRSAAATAVASIPRADDDARRVRRAGDADTCLRTGRPYRVRRHPPPGDGDPCAGGRGSRRPCGWAGSSGEADRRRRSGGRRLAPARASGCPEPPCRVGDDLGEDRQGGLGRSAARRGRGRSGRAGGRGRPPTRRPR